MYLFPNGSFDEASYSGGGNITLKGSLEGDTYFTAKIFQGELLFGNLPVLFTFSVRPSFNCFMKFYFGQLDV